MNLDDEICYCYGVRLRKLLNFARRTKPSRPSLMTECLGAGTGCGWCIPFLKRIAEDPERFAREEISCAEYAEQRTTYLKSKRPRNQF